MGEAKMDLTGLRKIIVGAVVLIVGVVIALYKNDIPPNLLQLLQVIFGGFIVGNVGEHVVGAVTARTDANVEMAKLSAPEPWDDEFAALSAQLSLVAADVEVVKGAAQHVAESPDGDEKLEAQISALKASLEGFINAERPDYASMVGGLTKSIDDIKLSSAANRNALAVVQNTLSTIISKAGLDQ